MTDQSSLAVMPATESRFLAPAATVAQAVERFQMMGQFVKAVMRSGADYGIIPGAQKPTLLKPGAEKLTTLFGLSTRFTLIESIYDWDGKDHDGEPFFYFHYRAQILAAERIIAEGEGSANSWEKKYRYRTADLVCPNCGKNTLLKSKKDPGYFCWAKKGGCGATFQGNDKRITEQPRGQVKNPDAADLVNTLQKMAQKRAYIAGVLLATNASEYFTQDIEDFSDYTPGEEVTDGQFFDAPLKQEQAPVVIPGNDGHAPVQPDLAGEINSLGEKLWPGCWIEKRVVIFQNLTADGTWNEEATLKFLRKRMGEITKAEGLKAHVAKSWPGYETFIPEIEKAQGFGFNQLAAIQGIADAAREKLEHPEIDDAIQLNVILAAFEGAK